MHFMDPYLYDQMRVERCDIHYAMPDGRIVPFCAFNVLPELYRDKVQNQYSIPWEEWKTLHQGQNPSEKYKRNIVELEKNEIYQKAYYQTKSFFSNPKQ